MPNTKSKIRIITMTVGRIEIKRQFLPIRCFWGSGLLHRIAPIIIPKNGRNNETRYNRQPIFHSLLYFFLNRISLSVHLLFFNHLLSVLIFLRCATYNTPETNKVRFGIRSMIVITSRRATAAKPEATADNFKFSRPGTYRIF